MTEATVIPRRRSLLADLTVFAADIRIAHSVFALPFALLATFLAAAGWPNPGQLMLIILCMVTARTFAMAANRILDARLDARNPRTAHRAIPSGRLSAAFYSAILLACAVAFIAATALFQVLYANPWPLALSWAVLLFVGVYPLLKRCTRLCHYWLGAALGLAPVCAWVAIDGSIAWPPIVMGAAVLLWTAGFDIIYACQDYHSDMETGVISIPAHIGIAAALWVSRITHLLSAALLICLGLIVPQFDLLYGIGAAAATILLIIEHSLVRANDLSRVGLAFFTVNGIISLVLGALGILDIFIR